MSCRTVLVGNAELQRCQRRVVDTANRVIRFNKAVGHRGFGGERTDQLWLVNHGGQMAEWLATGALTSGLVVPDVGEIVLPVPMLPGHLSWADANAMGATHGTGSASGCLVHPDRINHLDAARRLLEERGHVVRTLAVSDYRSAQRAVMDLIDGDREAFPSTGFLALHHLATHSAPTDRLELVGFTFEGWRGHNWDAERRWVERRVASGRMTVHPVDGAPERSGKSMDEFPNGGVAVIR